jgi:flagellar basal-body rod modification protein FlgD
MTINPTTPAASAIPPVAASGVTGQGNDVLGKDAFMQLLITKMQNQDPTAPQDDSALLAQLAQFSTLEQMQQMNTTLTGISDFFSATKAASAATAATTATDATTSTTPAVNP